MLTIEMIKWWYLRGWKVFLTKLIDHLKNAADFFSMGLLIKTLFAPFRQISVNDSAGASMEAKLSVFLNKLMSRLIGAVIRLFLLIVGVVLILLGGVLGIILMILWPLAPFGVAACLILTITGVAF